MIEKEDFFRKKLFAQNLPRFCERESVKIKLTSTRKIRGRDLFEVLLRVVCVGEGLCVKGADFFFR